jgi:hypothetical protein
VSGHLVAVGAAGFIGWRSTDRMAPCEHTLSGVTSPEDHRISVKDEAGLGGRDRMRMAGGNEAVGAR